MPKDTPNLDALPSLSQLRAELCRRSFERFVKEMWSIVDSAPLTWNFHLSAMCSHLQALYENTLGGYDNLLINVPPGSGKSIIVSVLFPAWIWTKCGSYTILSASGSDRVRTRESVKMRCLIDSPDNTYVNLFNISWRLTSDQNEKCLFVNSEKGFRQSATAGQRITGARSHCLLIDDPNDISLNTKVEREDIIHWYSQAFANRTILGQRTIRILIQQRVHEEDLTGWILANEPAQWCSLIIPQEFDPARKCITPIWEDPRTQEGELLFPAFLPREKVEIEKVRLGSSGYSSQHLQLPADANGERFKKSDKNDVSYVTYFSEDALRLQKFENIKIAIDPALKKGEGNDPSGIIVVGETLTDYWLLDNKTAKLSQSELEKEIISLAAKWKPSSVVIESNAHGEALVQRMEEVSKIPITPVYKSRDKEFYAGLHFIPLWEARKIKLPDFEPWVNDYLSELYAFPLATHDDQVDATSLALNELVGNNNTGFTRWLDRQVEKSSLIDTGAPMLMTPPASQSSAKFHGVEVYKDDNGHILVPADMVGLMLGAGWFPAQDPQIAVLGAEIDGMEALAVGPTGPTGATGPQGPTGPTGA